MCVQGWRVYICARKIRHYVYAHKTRVYSIYVQLYKWVLQLDNKCVLIHYKLG